MPILFLYINKNSFKSCTLIIITLQQKMRDTSFFSGHIPHLGQFTIFNFLKTPRLKEPEQLQIFHLFSFRIPFPKLPETVMVVLVKFQKHRIILAFQKH